MKRSILLTGIAILAMLFSLSCASSQAQQNNAGARNPVGTSDYTLSGPYTHKNLSIFLVHGKDQHTGKAPLTLQEAMAQKKIIVHETGEVNSLAIENVSNDEVYVQSGDIVKGGKQDRVLAMDLIVPPQSGKMQINSFCVEQGRWTGRGQEAVAAFSASDKALNSKELKIAANHKASQQEVWKQVAKVQEKLQAGVVAAATPAPANPTHPGLSGNTAPTAVSVVSDQSASSLQLTLENKHVRQTSAEYLHKLSSIIAGKNDVIGYVFAINGTINSADVYASHELFRKLWPKLLDASATEAIGELDKNAKSPQIAEADIKAFLKDAESGKAEEKEVTARIRSQKRETSKILFFESRDRQKDGAWLHRNYIAK
jgi:hypothetical protein